MLQIETHKLDFNEKAEARIGSKDTVGRRQVNLFCSPNRLQAHAKLDNYLKKASTKWKRLFKKLNANKNETCHVYGLWSDDYVSEDSAVMLTRPAGHEAEAEARKSEAEAEADAEWFCLEATWASRP